MGELFRMGTNGVLRRCVPMSARHLVISQSHARDAGDAEGHFAADITAKKVLATELWWISLHEDMKMYCK